MKKQAVYPILLGALLGAAPSVNGREHDNFYRRANHSSIAASSSAGISVSILSSASASATSVAVSAVSSVLSGPLSSPTKSASVTASITSSAISSAASNGTSHSATKSASSSSASASATHTPSKPVNGDGGWADAVGKAKAFVQGLSIDEKVNLTTGVDTVGRCVGNTGRVTRLNFDGFCLQDSPVGVRDADFTSVFPAGVNIAATWDAGLMWARGAAMGAEYRGKGVNVALGPMMNLARNAAGGRNWEGGGADPFLSGVHAAQNIEGIQSQGVIACAKHYVLNEQEHYRGGSGAEAYSSNQDDRSFHETQLWPFAESVHAGVGSVMCSYNRINQTFACENRHLLNTILKEELDFQGFMVSDWGAVESLEASVINGADMNMPGFIAYGDPDQPNPSQANNSYWGAQLKDAVQNGSIPESRFDDMVIRTMAAYYKLGQDAGFPPVNFDYLNENTYIDGQLVNEHVNVQADHYKVIREIGSASTVLLKNVNNTLPFDFSKVKSLAILGSDAGGNPDGPNGCTDRGCDQGTLAVGWGSGSANFPYLVTPYDAIQGHVRAENPTIVLQAVFNDYNYAAINTTANTSDACFVFANSDSGEGYITVDTNEGDRNNLTLWHNGDDLILSTAANCKNTVVVLHTVGPVTVERWYDHPNVTAILYAGLPGQESGNSLLDVILGTVNPSGRLPYTIAKDRSDYASDIVYSFPETPGYVPQINYTEKLNIDYRHFDSAGIEPRYEFGFGLSYTTFAYSGLNIQTLANPKTVPAGDVSLGGKTGLYTDALSVTFSVKNTGGFDGNEVAQLYLGFPKSANEPPRVLRGFSRQFIKKGQSAQFTIKLRVKDISVWDVVSQAWVVPSGEFTVYVGSSSRQLHLQKTISF
ncbi:glycoside hydrolase family 3 protein [Plicaturopsis crispa FD-325 SS-3]|nr:glycoside hydrolase family 3 protein [Plicaturopsis crispa FD-325 SS-3]